MTDNTDSHGLHHALLDLKQEGKIEFHDDDRDEEGDPTMSLSDDGRGAAVGLLQNNDDAVLFMLKIHFGQEFDELDSVSEKDVWQAITELAKTLRSDGVNLFRVLKRNPEKTPGIDVSNIPLSIIKQFDADESSHNAP